MGLISKQKCSSWDLWHGVQVDSQSNPGSKYTVLIPLPNDPVEDYICECDGYLYRGTCRHLQEAKELLCRWDGDPIQTKEQASDMICPKCGNKTIWSTEWQN
jgi:predicted RNA-binding Zn-ribbon protein involved in translation (DUF1610 family)